MTVLPLTSSEAPGKASAVSSFAETGSRTRCDGGVKGPHIQVPARPCGGCSSTATPRSGVGQEMGTKKLFLCKSPHYYVKAQCSCCKDLSPQINSDFEKFV